MGKKQQSIRLPGAGTHKASIVQCGNYRFAGACSRNHQVAIVPSDFPLCPETVKNFLLIRIGTNVKQVLQGLAMGLLRL